MNRQTLPLIRIQNLFHTYQTGAQNPVPSLRGIDLSIDEGEYVALIGANGSGKSTLLRHINALLLPSRGQVWVKNWNTSDSGCLRDIRSTVGMVFQAPDDQFVAATVEEEAAFGPENLGVEEKELRDRVEWSLDVVGLDDLKTRSPHLLSGGQKQLLAIASSLAMKPKCLLLDEATSMLDPRSADKVLGIVADLHSRGMTVLAATHSMEEAALAQRIVVIYQGKVVVDGSPREVFSDEQKLEQLKLTIPPAAALARMAARGGGFNAEGILSVHELVGAVKNTVERMSSIQE
ncbi:MAG: ATP-binding cassette domain-containing protein [Spirochaetota bacterium]